MFKFLLVALTIVSTVAFSPVRTSRFMSRTLNMVKMPPPPTIPKSGKPGADTIAGSADHKTLLAAVKAAGLVDVLNGAGSFVIFAPTDAAFAKLPAGTVDALLKDIPKLTNILKFHVSTNTQLPTRNGRAYSTLYERDGDALELGVRVTVDDPKNYILGGQKEKALVTASIQTTNGYVHVIDQVLLPYEGKEPPYMDIKEPIPAGYVTPRIG